MAQVSQALGDVYAEDALRRAIAGADLILIGFGFNDTAWGRLDDPCEAAPEFAAVQWDQISDDCQQRVTHELKQSLDVLYRPTSSTAPTSTRRATGGSRSCSPNSPLVPEISATPATRGGKLTGNSCPSI